jgi:phosphatidate cytidylyltransferase
MRPWERNLGIGLGLLVPIAAFLGQGEMVYLVLALDIFVLFVVFTFQEIDSDNPTIRMPVMLFGIGYVAFLLSHLLLLRAEPRGLVWVFFLMATVWAGDTFAYFTGTLIGRHKLYEKISPKKTFEGLFGGIAGSIVVALLFRRFLLRDLPLTHTVLLGMVILILGQIGDFGESMIKRSVNVKDSSQLIPGHGGLLDRLDSFLFSAPFLYYYVHFDRHLGLIGCV